MTATAAPILLLADRAVDLERGWVARPCGPLRLGSGPLALLRRLVAAGSAGLRDLQGPDLAAVRVALDAGAPTPPVVRFEEGTWRLRRGGGRAARAARTGAIISLAKALAGTADAPSALRLADEGLHPLVTPSPLLRGSLRTARVQLLLAEDAPDVPALRAELVQAGREAGGLLTLLGRIALLEGVLALRARELAAAELAFTRAQALAAPRGDVDRVVSALRWRGVVARRRADAGRADALESEIRRTLARAGRGVAA